MAIAMILSGIFFILFGVIVKSMFSRDGNMKTKVEGILYRSKWKDSDISSKFTVVLTILINIFGIIYITTIISLSTNKYWI